MAREEHQLLTGTCDEGSYQGQFLIATPVIDVGESRWSAMSFEKPSARCCSKMAQFVGTG